MKNKFAIAIVGLAAVAAWVGACNVPQPKPGCPIPRGAFSTTYTPKAGQPAACADFKGEDITLEKYPIPLSKEPADFAILPEGINNLGADDTNTSHKLLATGKVPVLPSSDDFCAATGITKQEQQDDADPTLHMAYEWSDFKVLQKGDKAVTGQQITGSVKITQDTVVCDYDFNGMYPSVDCTGSETVTLADGGEEENPIPDNDLCEPLRDLDAGRALGSGINQTFPTKCQDLGGDIFRCVLTQKVPAFR
jgi:hypothetical protein